MIRAKLFLLNIADWTYTAFFGLYATLRRIMNFTKIELFFDLGKMFVVGMPIYNLFIAGMPFNLFWDKYGVILPLATIFCFLPSILDKVLLSGSESIINYFSDKRAEYKYLLRNDFQKAIEKEDIQQQKIEELESKLSEYESKDLAQEKIRSVKFKYQEMKKNENEREGNS